MTRERQTPEAELVGADALDWRKLWQSVLEGTALPPAEIPINAVAWAFEVLCRRGFELERVMMFVQALWARFARLIGPVEPHAQPPAAEASTPAPPSPRAPSSEHARYDRELERLIEAARVEADAATQAFDEFAARVDAAGERFGDRAAWHVNVLGWALEVLYRRGYTPLELANLVTATWEVVAQRELERRARRGVPAGFAQSAPDSSRHARPNSQRYDFERLFRKR